MRWRGRILRRRNPPMPRHEAERVMDEHAPGWRGDLKRAYRAAAFRLHPDRGGDVRLMQVLNEANSVLERVGGAGAVPGFDRQRHEAEEARRRQEAGARHREREEREEAAWRRRREEEVQAEYARRRREDEERARAAPPRPRSRPAASSAKASASSARAKREYQRQSAGAGPVQDPAAPPPIVAVYGNSGRARRGAPDMMVLIRQGDALVEVYFQQTPDLSVRPTGARGIMFEVPNPKTAIPWDAVPRSVREAIVREVTRQNRGRRPRRPW